MPMFCDEKHGVQYTIYQTEWGGDIPPFSSSYTRLKTDGDPQNARKKGNHVSVFLNPIQR